jgi:hypothetical protein
VEAVVRSWRPFEPFVMRWANPGWILAPDLEASVLRKPKKSKSKTKNGEERKKNRDWTPANFATEIVGEKPSIRKDVMAWAKTAGMSRNEADALLKRGIANGEVHRQVPGPSEPPWFSSKPFPLDQDGSRGLGGPPAPPLPPSDSLNPPHE